jgi:hypothetical protein
VVSGACQSEIAHILSDGLIYSEMGSFFSHGREFHLLWFDGTRLKGNAPLHDLVHRADCVIAKFNLSGEE